MLIVIENNIGSENFNRLRNNFNSSNDFVVKNINVGNNLNALKSEKYEDINSLSNYIDSLLY